MIKQPGSLRIQPLDRERISTAHRRSRRPAPNLCKVIALSLLGAYATACSADAQQTRLALPFAERFTSATLDPAWTVHREKGNAIEIKDGALEFLAHTNSRAHVEWGLGMDFVRASCALKSISPGTTAALFVGWDASNYIQVGLNRRGACRLEAREVLGTYPQDYDLGPWTTGGWHNLAIELGEDCIRYLVSDHGKAFKCAHTSRRPERLVGVPALLTLGQDSEGKVFPPPNPWLPQMTEALSVCQVHELQVTPLSPEARKASASERRILERSELDSFGEQELAARQDPSFDSVSRHYPALKWSREVVGVKDHRFDVGVAADGSLQFTNDIAHYQKPTAFFEIGSYRFGSGTTPCSKQLLKGYLPIVITTDRQEGLQFEQTVFGHTKNFSPDEPLFAYVRFRAANTGGNLRKVRVRLRVEPASDKSPSLTWQLSVPGHGSQAVEVKLPYALLESPASQVPAEEFEARLAEVTACWDKLLAKGSRFEVPEPRVQNAYRAWMAYNFLNVAKRKGVFQVCDGSGFYGEVYGYSAALYCNALDLLGYHGPGGHVLRFPADVHATQWPARGQFRRHRHRGGPLVHERTLPPHT